MNDHQLTIVGKEDEAAFLAGDLTRAREAGEAPYGPATLTPEAKCGETRAVSGTSTRETDEGPARGDAHVLTLLGKERGVGAENGAPAGELPPTFRGAPAGSVVGLQAQLSRAASDWLSRTPSPHTRDSYTRDLRQFLAFRGIPPDDLAHLIYVRPGDVAAWRDRLQAGGATNATIRRKLTTLRSLFSYLQIYGYTGVNPAHGKFVKAPTVSRDGKTVGLSPKECRLLLEAPDRETPAGLRDRALLGVLAFTGCRVGELCRLRVGDYKASGGHKILRILGKGGKERTVPLHPEAFERLDAWLQNAGIQDEGAGALFRPTQTARGEGRDGFRVGPLSRRSVEYLIERYADDLGLDPAVSVHSLRVTALTTARERGADIIDLQDYAGHADPRTTLTYIRTRDRLSKSPAYLLAY